MEGNVTHFIGPERQLFIDDCLIECMCGLKRVLNQPEKHPGNPVLEGDRPHEGWLARICGNSVYYDEEDKIFKMWYDTAAGIGYAVSQDGIEWEKPDLGLFEYNGTRDHNLVYQGRNFSVIKDKREQDPAKRYKSLYWGSLNRKDLPFEGKGHQAAFSPDGIHWNSVPENPVIGYSNGVTDGQFVLGWDAAHRKYVTYLRPNTDIFDPPKRTVAWMTSEDFIRWDRCVVCLVPDERDREWDEYYRMTVTNYEKKYIGFLWVYYNDPELEEQFLESKLTFSRDGVVWKRAVDRKVFLPNSEKGRWDSKYSCICNMLTVGNEHFFYYLGANFRHTPRGEDGKKGSQKKLIGTVIDGERKAFAVGLAKMRLDGFVSIESKFHGSASHTGVPQSGVLTTRPMSFTGKRLKLNADSSHGDIRVEVLDGKGIPLEGYSKNEALPIRENSTEITVQWKGGRDLIQEPESFTGFQDSVYYVRKPVKLRFYLTNAKLYSFQIV